MYNSGGDAVGVRLEAVWDGHCLLKVGSVQPTRGGSPTSLLLNMQELE